ncbi:LCP family protein [Streptantibioticus rubrisoli]|uniref:LCP family protein n=1 Tax=Streptantibioticus rubrisoli TaxID=1387313 RepID=A0ABT1PG32_9ACTN|nr:LCP family protein [Streptantibioticus rubrisoli]MCQ4044333.1 LCP family protein [Streptantibioticus rubrisoli]
MGFGGDLDRIKLQQQFLSSLIRKMKSSGNTEHRRRRREIP